MVSHQEKRNGIGPVPFSPRPVFVSLRAEHRGTRETESPCQRTMHGSVRTPTEHGRFDLKPPSFRGVVASAPAVVKTPWTRAAELQTMSRKALTEVQVPFVECPLLSPFVSLNIGPVPFSPPLDIGVDRHVRMGG